MRAENNNRLDAVWNRRFSGPADGGKGQAQDFYVLILTLIPMGDWSPTWRVYDPEGAVKTDIETDRKLGNGKDVDGLNMEKRERKSFSHRDPFPLDQVPFNG